MFLWRPIDGIRPIVPLDSKDSTETPRIVHHLSPFMDVFQRRGGEPWYLQCLHKAAHDSPPFFLPPTLPVLATKLTGALDGLVRFRRTDPATALERTGLVELLLGLAVVGVARLFRVNLGALGDGHHGAVCPDVDGLGPIQAVDAAALDGDDVLVLREMAWVTR